MLNLTKIFSLFNTQPNRPSVSPASFKHVGQVLYSRGFKFGENGPIKIWVHFWPPGPRWLNLTKIFSLFNTQPNRPRASPASFKHVGQVLYSRGFKFAENGPIKIWVHFGLQVRGGWIWRKVLVFNTQPNRPNTSPASFKHVGRSSTQGASNLGKTGRSKFGSILAYRSAVVEFDQNFLVFNTQPNRPRAYPASFKHVGQVLYSRGFKFGKNGPIKICVNFGLQVRGGWIWPKFLVFSTHNPIGLGPPLQVPSMYCRSSTQGACNLGKTGWSKFGSILASRSAVVEFDQNF